MDVAALLAMHAHAHERSSDLVGRAFALTLAVNAAFVIVEVVVGAMASSLALVSDAMHNAADALGLAVAWGAVRLARRLPTSRRTYGLRRATILAALANATLVLAGVAIVAFEAIRRIGHAAAPHGAAILVTAAIGVAVNGVSALVFARSGARDANVRAAFAHLAADAAVSVGVVASGAVILATGWRWVDPVVAIAVSAAVVVGTLPLLREALDLALDAVPRGIDPSAVRRSLLSYDAISEVHDLHIWPLSTTETALTAHLVANEPLPAELVDAIAHALEHEHHIDHATLQVEPLRDRACGCDGGTLRAAP